MDALCRLDIRVVDSSAEFLRLKQDWENLLDTLEEYPPFLTWEWMYLWWEIYSHKSAQLKILVFEKNKSVVAIAPFYTVKSAFPFMHYRVKFLGTGEPEEKEVCSEYLDLITSKEYADEAYGGVFNYFGNFTNLCIIYELFRIKKNSYLLQYLEEKQTAHLNLDKQICGYKYCLVLHESWEDYLGSLKASRRRSIVLALNKISNIPNYQLKFIDSFEAVSSTMQKLKHLHTISWNDRGRLGAFASPEFFKFHLSLAKQYFDKGMLSLAKIEINNKTVAILYNLKTKNSVYYYQSGFSRDDCYSNLSLGVIAHSESIKKAINSNLKNYDFLMGGKESYKSRYGCEKEEMYNLILYSNIFVKWLYILLPKGFSKVSAAMRLNIC